jgi:hypothetical protein
MAAVEVPVVVDEEVEPEEPEEPAAGAGVTRVQLRFPNGQKVRYPYISYNLHRSDQITMITPCHFNLAEYAGHPNHLSHPNLSMTLSPYTSYLSNLEGHAALQSGQTRVGTKKSA